jgi:hypothetical protein
VPRPSRPWFRFYVEALNDPKLRRLDPAERWLWVAILGAARASCEPGVLLVAENEPYADDELAHFASVPLKVVKSALPKMERLGMLARDDSGWWWVPSWDERQFESDDVTSRTRRHRNGQGTGLERSNVVPGNGPETETDTDPLNPLVDGTFGDPIVVGPAAKLQLQEARKARRSLRAVPEAPEAM